MTEILQLIYQKYFKKQKKLWPICIDIDDVDHDDDDDDDFFFPKKNG